jgi:hypothetical protein
MMDRGYDLEDPEGNPIFICEDFLKNLECVNCGQGDFIEIDTFNLISIKRPKFPAGWTSMTESELAAYYCDDYDILCNECKTFQCKNCVNSITYALNGTGVKLLGLCVNKCEQCGWACDDEECECD